MTKEELGPLLKRISYIECESGWFPIIKELDEKLSIVDPDYSVQQIKEKSAALA